jgi:hypothetical protein
LSLLKSRCHLKIKIVIDPFYFRINKKKFQLTDLICIKIKLIMKKFRNNVISNKLPYQWKAGIIFIFTVCTWFIYCPIACAQFTILSPPSTCQVIEDIDVDSSGRILFATDDGILIYDTNQTWIHFNTLNGLAYSHVKAIKHAGNYFIFSEVNKTIGTCNYVSITDTVFNSAFNYGYISALYIDSIGNTLLGTDNGAVFLENTGGIVSQLNLGLTLGIVNHIVYLTNPPLNSTNFYGITSANKGVLFDLSSNQTLFIVSNGTSPLPNDNIISCTYIDNVAYDGTADGLFIVDFSFFPTVSFSILNTSNSPLPNDTINAVAISGGSMFIGTPEGLLVRLNNIWTVFDISNSNLPSNNIGELALHGKDLWIGTKQGNICKIDTTQLVNSINTINNNGEGITFSLNPDNEFITLKSIFKFEGIVLIYDISGKLITKANIHSDKSIISTKNYSGGMYFYQVIDKSGILLKSGKLIIHNF